MLDNGMELDRIVYIHTNKLYNLYSGNIEYFCDDCLVARRMKPDEAHETQPASD